MNLPFSLLLLLVFHFGNTYACVGNNPTQLSALQDLYASTSGIKWIFPPTSVGNNWESSSDYCSWKNVVCDSSCNYIQQLNLSGVGMRGPLPSSLSNLFMIQILDFSHNGYLNGTLPALILTNFDNLVTLNVGYTSLTGYVNGMNGGCTPSLTNVNLDFIHHLSGYDFSQCKGLRTISMDSLYSPTFYFPTSSAASPCYFPNLISVNIDEAFLPPGISGNNVTDISCFCSSPLLEYLSAGGNYITGDIPDCLSTLENLKYFSVAGNKYTSFKTNGGYKNLAVVDLSEGMITEEFSTLYFPSLIKGIFSNNQFYGTPFLNISPVLEILTIDNNNFSGDFPNPTIAPFPLQVVDARNNLKMTYTNYYFRPSDQIVSVESLNGVAVFCAALNSLVPTQSAFTMIIYVSSSYYKGSSYYSTACLYAQT